MSIHAINPTGETKALRCDANGNLIISPAAGTMVDPMTATPIELAVHSGATQTVLARASMDTNTKITDFAPAISLSTPTVVLDVPGTGVISFIGVGNRSGAGTVGAITIELLINGVVVTTVSSAIIPATQGHALIGYANTAVLGPHVIYEDIPFTGGFQVRLTSAANELANTFSVFSRYRRVTTS